MLLVSAAQWKSLSFSLWCFTLYPAHKNTSLLPPPPRSSSLLVNYLLAFLPAANETTKLSCQTGLRRLCHRVSIIYSPPQVCVSHTRLRRWFKVCVMSRIMSSRRALSSLRMTGWWVYGAESGPELAVGCLCVCEHTAAMKTHLLTHTHFYGISRVAVWPDTLGQTEGGGVGWVEGKLFAGLHLDFFPASITGSEEIWAFRKFIPFYFNHFIRPPGETAGLTPPFLSRLWRGWMKVRSFLYVI